MLFCRQLGVTTVCKMLMTVHTGSSSDSSTVKGGIHLKEHGNYLRQDGVAIIKTRDEEHTERSHWKSC